MHFLCAFAVLLGYKLLANASRMMMVRFYRSKYTKYISSKNFDFTIYTYSIKKLFERAGVREGAIPFAQPIGGGYMKASHALLFENMGVLSNDVPSMMNSCFSRAYGTYRTRLWECFSPLYWIECIIFLPRKMMSYLGIKDDGLLCKSLQLIYWLVAPIAVAFRSDIYGYISELISKAQQIP